MSAQANSQESLPQQVTASSCLSVDLNDAAQLVSIPFKCLEGIWSKASKLVSNNTAIALALGQDSEARMVLSYSGKAPHLVTPKKGGDYSSCPNWKAMGICAHCVAVAEINKKLSQFLSSKKRKKQANITNLLTTGTPKGRG